jgi:hypothetical protein
MAKIQERAEKKKVGDQTAGKLSAAEIVKALQEHIASIVTPEKAGSTEDELAAESAANQAQTGKSKFSRQNLLMGRSFTTWSTSGELPKTSNLFLSTSSMFLAQISLFIKVVQQL